MHARKVLDWLKGEDQPAVRYLTMRDLEKRPAGDPELREARAQVAERGWVADILQERHPEGWWVHGDSLYTPKYTATNWRMLVLADLGAGRHLPAVRASAEVWMRGFPLEGGGVGGNSKGRGHHCVVGNLGRALVQMGYGDDPRVRKSLEWLVRSADPKGGWSCFSDFSPGRNLDSWEGLSAFAAYPRSRWNASMERCVEQGVEFFLERELHRQGARYAPWYRFHYPVHYYYDLLVGLDLMTALGHGDDPRLKFALSLLRSKRRPDGRWNLDAVHPDAEGSVGRWWKAHPPQPFALETAGRPSKMITLRALRVLSRLGE